MKTVLIVDGEFHGRGIRGVPISSLNPETLSLPTSFKQSLSAWLDQYATLHKSSYANQQEAELLDVVGMNLAKELQQIVGPEFQVYYYSDANTTKYVLDNGQFRVVPVHRRSP